MGHQVRNHEMCTIVPVDVTPTPSTRRDRLHRDKYEDAMREVIQGDAVTLEYSALLAGADLTGCIQTAFGEQGLGLLLVRGVPGLGDARGQLLPLARRFAELDESVKAKYVHEPSKYSFGWSHGKEKLQGKPDVSKGSYYANPQYDRPVDDESIIAQHSAFVHPNIWPTDDLPELEPAFKLLGQLVVDTGVLVAKQCDAYLEGACSSYPRQRLQNVIETSKCCKARLLHYFPISSSASGHAAQGADDEFSSWCGWHNDHGSLTGLVSAIYIDSSGAEVPNADPSAGLYILSRRGELVKVSIPADCVAYQIGETAQIHSGGLLQATPHAVRGSSSSGVSRETFAVFMEPMWTEPMSVPSAVAPEQAQSQSAASSLPHGVPPLAARWRPGQTFGDFTSATLSAYY